MTKPNTITTEAEYETTLAHLEILMNAEPNSPQEEEMKLLAVLVEEYELEHYPIAAPDPIEAIKFRMEQQGSTQKLSTGR